MAEGNIETRVEKRLRPIIEDLNYDLYDVQFVKEGKDYYLRIIIDKDGTIRFKEPEVFFNKGESELKIQFKKYEEDIKELNIKKEKLLNQINILNQNQNNIEKIEKSIQEEIEGGSLEEFIRKFVDEVIVSKINNDRYNVKLDIYLNLLGDEKPKSKGASHIDGATDEDILYLENQFCETIEVKRSIDTPNKFTYNVYVESL